MKRYVAEFVYGATDGAVTTFAVIAGTVGANLDPVVVLLLGVSNLLADGFSMAASNYLAKRSENELVDGAPSLQSPLASALATFGSFVLVGAIPLVPFVVARVVPGLVPHQFKVAIFATSAAFLFIGAMRGRVTSRNSFAVALETLVIGGVAALIAYGVGSLVHTLVR